MRSRVLIVVSILTGLLLLATLPASAQDGGQAGAGDGMGPGEGLESAITGSNYRLGPGDVLIINIFGPQPIAYTLSVTPEGKILVPAVGELRVDNLLLADAKEAIRARVLGFFRNVDVDVALVRLRRFQIHVLGQVKSPGTYTATAVERVSAAIARAGGFAEGASRRRVLVQNADSLRITADLAIFLKRGSLDHNPWLRDGDVVYVPFVREKYQVLGWVNEPGPIQYLEGDRLHTALELAGGFTAESFADTLDFARYRPGELDPVRMRIIPGLGVVPWRPEGQDQVPAILGWFTMEQTGGQKGPGLQYPDFELQPADLVLVRQTPQSRKRLLAEIEGEVLYPGAYPIREGQTRLAEVIRIAGGLTRDAFLVEAKLIRQASIGLVDKEFERLKLMPVADMSEDEYAYFKARSREIQGAMVVDFQDAIADESSPHNVLLERGDLIVIPKRRDSVSVLGLVRRPGSVTYRTGLAAKDYVRLAGGYASDADRAKARVIRAEGGEWVNLRKAGELRRGDTVFIPEKPDLDYWKTFRDFLTVALQIVTIYLVVDNATR